jgi:hypothetical protein
MTHSVQNRGSATARLSIVAGLLILLVTTIAAQARTYTVLHSFTGHGDGANPAAGLTMDRAGNFYGTSSYGGYSGGGWRAGQEFLCVAAKTPILRPCALAGALRSPVRDAEFSSK